MCHYDPFSSEKFSSSSIFQLSGDLSIPAYYLTPGLKPQPPYSLGYQFVYFLIPY